jgi:hypothetical protein
MKKILSISTMLLLWGCLHAQTPMITDGMMTPKKDLGNGIFYSFDSWNKYWEGTLKRDNQNIGTLTTQAATWMGVYGLTERITLIGMLPYVWSKASGGTLHSMQGLQDVTIAAKYNYFNKEWGPNNLRFFALGSYSMPVTNYTPDFLPLSIGMGCKNLSGRLTTTYSLHKAWTFTGSAAYTWRSNIFLDRPSYYTNGQMYFSDEVQMYDQFDFIVRAGYHQPTWHAELFYTQQNTLGGGDIRKQDMPFASNQMNYSKIGASFLYAIPQIKNLAARAWGSYTIAGRNVGQSTTINAGLMYTLHFSNTQ